MKTIKLYAILLAITLTSFTSWAQDELKTDLTKQTETPAYLMAFVRVQDFDTYNKEYLEKATPIIMRHGGKPIAVSENPTLIEGKLPKGKLVIVEFPSMKAAEGFYNDPEYQPLIKVRNRVSKSDAMLFERGF